MNRQFLDRQRGSLVLLLLFVVCTGVAIVVSGSRSGLHQGIAPVVVQFAGYLSALGAAALLLTGANGRVGEGADDTRKTGGMVLGAVLVLAVVDVLTLDQGGANIGAGLVRVVGLVVIMVATIRLARATAAIR